MRRRTKHKGRFVVAAAAVAAVVAASVVTASVSYARQTSPADSDQLRAPEPAAQVEQIPERGTRSGRTVLAGDAASPGASRTVCDDGATWLRLRFTRLDLHGGDTVTLAGSAGGAYTLKAKHWPGKAFYTRAFSGECVTVTPQLADPRSRYAVDAYQSGSQSLAQASVTVAAAGDICGSACNQTAEVVSGMDPNAVILAGDNAYDSGTLAEYQGDYDDYWGPFKSKTRPSPGNHDYKTSGASGYFDYFNGEGNDTGPAGERGKGYYSFDVGDWHFIALNSNISRSSTSSQVTWLKNDLASNTKPCTAAYWHHPRFAEGNYGDDSTMVPFYQALYDAKADLIINGHDHNYQRYAPAKPDGTTDATNGVRQIIIGTGGRALYGSGSGSDATKEASNYNTFGVGKLTLTATSYTVDFVPVAGRTFEDNVTGSCKKASTGSGFGVAASPSAVSVPQGSSGSASIAVSSSGGFNSAVNLTVSGLPTGVTAAFTPTSVTPPTNGSGNATLTLTASGSAPVGNHTVTVTGTSGGVTRTAAVQVTVTAPGSAVFSDDFETDKGWTVNPSGTDTATTGTWERGDPAQTFSDYSKQIKQLGDAVSGVNTLTTGRLAGSNDGSNDLDGGDTSIGSPAVTLPATSAAVTFSWNVAHGDNSSADDYLRVSVVRGTTKTKVWEKVGAASEVAGSWRTATVDLSAYAGQSVTLLIEAADAAGGSLFEAQVDDLTVVGSGATPSPTPSPTASPTVTPPTGCGSLSNGTDVAIPDAGAAVTSSIPVAGCSGNAPPALKVEVHIRHTFRGDLVIDLIAPDGTAYRLKDSSTTDDADNVDATYSVDASAETANGTWKLQVRDVFTEDSGYLDTWSLHFG